MNEKLQFLKKLLQDFKRELDDSLTQNLNYQSLLKVKNQQIQSLHKILIKSLIESKPDDKIGSDSISNTEGKDKLISELS